MSDRSWRRPPSRAWLKKYPQKSRSSMYSSRPRPSRAGYSTVPRSRGVYAAGEMKYFDTECSSANMSQTWDWTGTELPPNQGTPNTLVVPTQGSAINQRIGRKIKLYKLRIKGIVTVVNQEDQTDGDYGQHVIRLALVQDMQTNGTQAQGETIFQDPTAANSEVSINTFQNLDISIFFAMTALEQPEHSA